MTWEVSSYKDLFEIISYIITSLSLIAIWFTYAFSKKQIHLLTMHKCISDFRNIVEPTADLTEDEKARQYCELVNEELFYVEHNFLHKVVAVEWLDGMIDFLPFISSNRRFFPSISLDALKDYTRIDDFLKTHPRVLKAVTLRAEDFDAVFQDLIPEQENSVSIAGREKLISLIIDNLSLNRFDRYLYKCLIAKKARAPK